MKLRIKGNSVRLRLSKPEVEQLSYDGAVTEQIHFANADFIYSIKKSFDENNIRAEYHNNQLTVYVPANLLNGWPGNNVISLDNRLADGSLSEVYVLVEKDFKCIDDSSEDQSDNYENPKTC